MKMKTAVLVLSFGLLVAVDLGASRADRKREALEESERPVAVKGATPLVVPLGFDAAFDAVVKTLQKADEGVAVASRDTGLIATELTITGKGRQTGTRTVLTLIKEAPSETVVKVAVTTQKRYKVLQTEPWSDPELDRDLTAAAAEKFRAALGAK